MLIPVILAGGSGERLWPLSRQTYPKQFLKLSGDNTLLQDTIERLPSNLTSSDSIIVCNEEHRFIVAEQTRIIDKTATVILEPEGKNTAPAIALACFEAIKKSADAIVIVMPSDHLLADLDIFQKTIENSISYARDHKLVTFGITPTSPETGYGYIKQGEKLEANINAIAKFIEKPNINLAKQLLAAGDCLFNSGMFMFKASVYLDELKKFEPVIYEQTQNAMAKAMYGEDFIRPDLQEFRLSINKSIDYAVMEKTQNAIVANLACKWSDIGSWQSLWQASPKDASNNHTRGNVILENSNNCLVQASDRLVVALGLDNIAVIETDDAILVADQNESQNVKDIVTRLKQEKHRTAIQHTKVNRPWGTFTTISEGNNYQVKLIEVLPGKKLSLQLHYHRAEHWVVVDGKARIVRGKETLILAKNESTYIPIEVKHQLENIGDAPLLLVEVQCGDYLGEDDIVRFEDQYQRVVTSERVNQE